MLNSISSFEIILILFPGFLTLLVKNGLVTTKEKTGVDKIVEALAYNLLNYESALKTPIKQIANILFQNWAIGGI